MRGSRRMGRGPITVCATLCAVGASAMTGLSARAYERHRGPLPAVGGTGPSAAANIDTIENLGQRIPRGLEFSEGHGKRVGLDSLLGRGKPVLLTLGYYRCPMLCNLVHEGLVKAIKGAGLVLGKDFLGVAVSVDPNEDPKSAATNEGRLLRSLAHGQREDWPFLFERSPGMTPNVTALAQAVGFRYKYDEQSKQFAHAAVAVILSPEGKISRYLYGVDVAPRDLRMALVEAADGRVGTTLDRVLLTCFKYDPMMQRYTPYALAFVKIGAGLSFLALAGLLLVLWRKELQMRRRRVA